MTTITARLSPIVGPRDLDAITQLHAATAAQFAYDESRHGHLVISGHDQEGSAW